MDLRKVKSTKGFTLIELMVVIVIIGILVAIALPNFIAAQDRAKLSSVKSNMHTVQTVTETYAVDWGGVYADNMSVLYTEAVGKAYWKEFKNPFTASTAADNAYMSATAVATVDTGGAATGLAAGSILYDPILSAGTITKYYIYGGSKEVDKALLDKGVSFFLTNQ